MKEDNKKNVVFTLFVSICLFSIIYGGIGALDKSANTEEDKTALSAQAVIGTGLSLDADVEWQYYYTKCGHSKSIIEKMQADMIGKTSEEIAGMYDAELVSFSEDKIVLKKTINGYCSDHYILKKDGDYLSIYTQASISEDLKLFMKTTIYYDFVNEEMKEEIKEGKAFDTIEEIEYFLEDIDT